jgi:ElaA protein
MGARLDWICKPLRGLSALELHRIHCARAAVFVVEQHCPFQDPDETDEHCWHLAAWHRPLQGSGHGADERDPGELLAYARLVPPGVKYEDASIGRVITTAAARGTGLGRELVRRAIVQAAELFPGQALRISAQSRLEAFYQEAGFVIVSERYLEDDIDHTEMLRQPGPL